MEVPPKESFLLPTDPQLSLEGDRNSWASFGSDRRGLPTSVSGLQRRGTANFAFVPG